MKKIGIVFLIFVFLLGMAGCKISQKGPAPAAGDVFLSVRQGDNGEVITTHLPKNASLFPHEHDEAAIYAPAPTTYDEVLKTVQENGGLIVVGQAHGEREGHYHPFQVTESDDWILESGYTLTPFTVGQVLYGELDATEITISENYVLREQENHLFYFVPSGSSTILQNEQLVLLYLAPAKSGEKHHYCPVYDHPFPVQEGYMNYGDEYLEWLCAYYKGDRSAYQFSEPTEETVTIRYPDQTVAEQPISLGGDYWPEREISNDDLLAELCGQFDEIELMIRTAQEFGVCLYPVGHKNNPIDVDLLKETAKAIALQEYKS